MDEKRPVLPLSDWLERRPEGCALSADEWRKYITTLAENLPAGTTLDVMPRNSQGHMRFHLRGQPTKGDDHTFEAISYYMAGDNALRLLSINSAQKGMGHTVLFAQLAAATEAGIDAAHIRAGQDGVNAWSYWGIPLNFGGSPDFDTSVTAQFVSTVKSKLQTTSVAASATGKRLLSRLARRDENVHTALAHRGRQKKFRSLLPDILNKSGMWDGMVLLGHDSPDLQRMFKILKRHHRRHGTTSVVGWRPLKPKPAPRRKPAPAVEEAPVFAQ